MLSQTQLSSNQIKNFKPGKRNRTSLKWKCTMGETFISDKLIVPLTSLKKVTYDDKFMGSNNREYVFRCYQEKYALFSIRTRAGERLCTLHLSKTDNQWFLEKCLDQFGKDVLEETLIYMDEEENVVEESVPTELYYISQEIVRLMNNLRCH